MNIGEILHGFRVEGKECVREIGGTVYTMRHVLCGARLVFIDREDDNKTFSIAFKTLPTDDSGVFHIIEHSVLCGSERYPVKDPFVELLKGSLNTFLNAMTFQDKTMYPVSSRNDKDFYNLVSVYMDAVLHPNVITSPLAFYQEGWHYEYDAEADKLSYKGVVLNEMRGEYSSPEVVADYNINRMLYGGTPYEYDSGGKPEGITSLTYEGFVRAYKRCYNPSGAELFLDGSVVLDEILPLLDGFLSPYPNNYVDEKIPDVKIKAPVTREVSYEIGEGESTKDKTRVYEAYMAARFDEQMKILAQSLIFNVLFSTNESAGKRELLSLGLCEDVNVSEREGIKEGAIIFEFVNVKDGKEGEISDAFLGVISGILEKGIDKRELSAALNATEFRMREGDYGSLPRGVAYAMTSLESLLYSPDPVQNLRYEDTLSALREAIDTDYYDRLLSEIIIDNPRRATLVMHPSLTLAEQRLREEAGRLSSARDELSDAGIADIVKMNGELLQWQGKEDSEEALATLPTLTVADVPSEVRKTPLEAYSVCGREVIHHGLDTSGITYAELYFDASDMTERELALLSLLNTALSQLPTQSYTAPELHRLIKSELGELSVSMTALEREGEAKIYVVARVSALDVKKDKIPDIATEILTRTLFSDPRAIKNLLRQLVISAEEGFAASGHQIALSRCLARASRESAIKEYYSGYEGYIALKKIDRDFDNSSAEILDELRAITVKYFTRPRLTVGITGVRDDVLAEKIINSFPGGDVVLPVCQIPMLPSQNEAIIIPAQVAFAASGYNVIPLGEGVSGSFDVVRNLVGYRFLWGRIRVRGGAYGAGMSAGISGNLGFYSYRDPSPASSILAFGEVADFLREFAASGEDITKYVIGAVGDGDPIRTPRMRGMLSTVRYLRGITYEDSCLLRRQLLSTDKDELIRLAGVIEECVNKGTWCVVLGRDKLNTLEGEPIVLEI